MYGQQVGALRLLARGMNPSVAAPLAVAHKDLSTPEARRGMVMAFLPYLLILSAFIGGAYLIIDATAGERERQSLEPLARNARASRRGGDAARSRRRAWSARASLLLTLLAFKTGARSRRASGADGREHAGDRKMLLILVPMLFIGTSLLTFIAAGAKSVKEAQSYMSVLMLLPMIPTIALMVSPVKNQLWMFAVPFLAQNQMLMKVVRGETMEPMQWGCISSRASGWRWCCGSRRRAVPPGAVGDLGLIAIASIAQKKSPAIAGLFLSQRCVAISRRGGS